MIPPTDADHFTDWLLAVIAYRRARSPEQVAADIATGLAEAVRFGTTLIGDISADGGSWAALADAPLRAVVFRELIGLSRPAARRVADEAAEWVTGHPATDTCRPGLSPHAPYSVGPDLFAGAADLCRARKLPLAVHLAESPAETELLYHRTGPFAAFLKRLGVWADARFATGYSRQANTLVTPLSVISAASSGEAFASPPEPSPAGSAPEDETDTQDKATKLV